MQCMFCTIMIIMHASVYDEQSLFVLQYLHFSVSGTVQHNDKIELIAFAISLQDRPSFVHRAWMARVMESYCYQHIVRYPPNESFQTTGSMVVTISCPLFLF